MYYLLERINKTCENVKKYIHKKEIIIENFKYIGGNYKNIDKIKKIKNNEFTDFESGEFWGGKDKHGWFKFSIEVPKDFDGETVALAIYTFEEGWDATNPQFILYVNEEQIQGIDINHREVILSHNAKAGEIYNIDLHAYSGMLANKRVTLYSKFLAIDMNSRELYFNLKVAADACAQIDSGDKDRINMIDILTKACNLIDFRKSKGILYDESVIKANRYLNKEFYENKNICGYNGVMATCVGHTHIDVAWLWTVEQTREKVSRSFSTVLKLMEEYPEYIFMSSQPQLYQFLKEDYPKIYQKVKEKIKEGRWEAEGGMWVESDCNVVSGESLVRQILYGKRFFKEEFNVDNKILWLPDVFGYSAALPQILRKSDMKYFMTTKISWNQFNQIPNDTFIWKGIDGSEILTHFITTTNPGEPTSKRTTYNGHIEADTLVGAWKRYQNKNINDDVLVSFGWGDGGGGATPEMLEKAKRFAKGLPGIPKVKMGTALDYFERLEKKIENNKRLEIWNGELYLEYHRGTYTTMARNKRDNRKCENLYVALEKMNSLSMILGEEYLQKKIDKSWKNILLNQFHDIIPGSSIKEVYDVTKIEYKELLEKGNKMLDKSILSINKNINLAKKSLIVTNVLGFKRDDIVIFDIPKEFTNICVMEETGEKLPIQITKNKAMFFAKDIPANGYKAFEIIDEKFETKSDMKISTKNIENDFFKITLDDKAMISSFIFKENNREILKKNRVANELQAFEDKPMCFANWDIDIFYKEKMWNIDDISLAKVIEDGPVRATIKVKRVFLDSTITQYIRIYKNLGRIDFENVVDWKEEDILLKVCFPVDINVNEATYEIQYGNLKRPTHKNTSWDLARFEVCAHKWVDLSENGFGVSLLNDSKYGHDILEGDMRITLIKSTCDPYEKADKEIHYYTYSLYPHINTWKEAQTTKSAYNLNNPLIANVEEPHNGILEKSLSILEINVDNVMIEVIKKAEDTDHLIVRLYEYHNRRTSVNLKAFREIKEIKECNLIERNLKEIVLNKDKNNFSFIIKPYEIKTFKIKF